DIFNHDHDKIYQDMTHPLTHYYVASSHNTYLLQDQLRGPSSVDAYINALRKGCRCVELDCWDGDNGEPIVYHGHTLTSKILFKDVIQGISKHAFEVSEYPVILSLENHCSLPNQKKMAEYLEAILGDMLYKVPVDAQFDSFPSPEFFKNRILIKGKKLKLEHETDDEDVGDVTDEDEAADIDQEAAAAEKNGKKTNKLKLAKELSRCVNYVSSVGFKGFEHAKQNYKFHQMSSFVESKMASLMTNSGSDFVEYNKRQLSRIYPAGGRVDSSNYNPQQAWNAGCQIVALNYQTDSEPMHLNQGKFRVNGRAGYILKPKHLRDHSRNREDKDTYKGKLVMTLNCWALTQPIFSRISGRRPLFSPRKYLVLLSGGRDRRPEIRSVVISGQQLPKPAGTKGEAKVIDPYVKVDFHGIPADTASFKTKVVKDNGFNPMWKETFEKELLMPELAMIRFVVFDEDVGSRDDFIGQFSLPFTSVRPG
ncbi:unnamed protein product, partial [Porites evermanni]